MIMKKQILLGGLVLLTLASAARATLVINYDSGTINQGIPDANPAGVALSQNYSGLFNGDGGAGISQVDVQLNITGGYNGDLYGYLVFQSTDGNTLTSILLNRVGRTDASGFGSSQSGFGSITLSSSGSWDNIHDVAGNPAGGTYLADGRTVSPNGDFNGASTSAGLNLLDTHNVNGTWTLFLADLSGGDQSTLVSWGLEVSVVPEPTTWALIGFVALLAGGKLVSRRRRTA